MKEKLIRKIFLAGDCDLKAIEEYLEDMAKKGLMFVKSNGCLYYFAKCKPKKLRFSVDVFSKASIFDTKPEESTEEYIDYCEEAGWHYLFTNGKLQYFYSESENTVPIQTDDNLHLSLINEHVLKTSGLLWISISFMVIMFILQQLAQPNLVNSLIMNGNTGIVHIVLLLITFADIIKYFIFYIKNKIRLNKGMGLTYYTKNQTSKYNLIRFSLVVSALVFLISSSIFDNLTHGILLSFVAIIIVGLAFIVQFFKNGNVKLGRKDNFVFTLIVGIGSAYLAILFITLLIMFKGTDQIVPYYNADTKEFSVSFFSHEKLPITMEELGINISQYNDASSYCSSSLFGYYNTYEQFSYKDDLDSIYSSLEYEIVGSRWNRILDSYIEDICNKSYYECTDVTDNEKEIWNCDTVYSLYYSEANTQCRLVKYDNHVLFISGTGIEYNQDNISLICDTLLKN